MRILVTGANGFLGRHAVQRLAAAHHVLALMRTPPPAQIPACEPIVADLTQERFEDQLPPTGVDAVLFLAQSRHHRRFPEHAADLFEVNVRSVFRLVEWARRHGVRKFVYTSSANVYALSDQAIAENHPLAPGSFYARTKLMGEGLVQSYAEFFPTLILRLFTPYGPGQRGALIPDLIERVARGKPVTLQGDEGLWLSPWFVDDVCSLLQTALEETAPTERCTLLNAGGAEAVSIRGITQIIGRQLRRPVLYQEQAGPAPKGWVVDASRLRARFPLPAVTPLEEGMRKTIRDVLAA